MKYADHQPDKIPDLRNSLFWSQFTNSANPSTIGLVDRHGFLLVEVFVAKPLYPISHADQYSFVKVSGR
jgi:hypothetical protein